jgi:DNA-binding IclR family transcriptional regulator
MTTSASAAASREHEVSALARGLAVLRAVADAEHPVSNRELAEATGIPKATVSRLAATLVSGGLLRQDAHSERFSLGSGLLELGNVFLRRFDLRSHARPRLAALAELAGTAVHLGVRDGLDVLVVDSLRASSALILSRIDVGSRMAIATSAAGRAYLSSLPPAERESLRAEIRAAAGRGWARVAKRLDAAQAEHDRAGYCSSFGEWHPHIHALGFALRGPRGERYAVSCGGPAYLLSPEHLLGEVAPAMLAARDEIEREVGATG